MGRLGGGVGEGESQAQASPDLLGINTRRASPSRSLGPGTPAAPPCATPRPPPGMRQAAAEVPSSQRQLQCRGWGRVWGTDISHPPPPFISPWGPDRRAVSSDPTPGERAGGRVVSGGHYVVRPRILTASISCVSRNSFILWRQRLRNLMILRAAWSCLLVRKEALLRCCCEPPPR